MTLFSRLHEKINFYTLEDAGKIESVSGFYAWYLPLHFFDEDLNKNLKIIGEIYSYDPRSFKKNDEEFCYKNPPLILEDNWTHSQISIVKKEYKKNELNRELLDRWCALKNNERVEDTFLISSILMRPLYIGKSNMLSRRYNDHITNSNFKERFESHMEELGVCLGVKDLIFASVKTDLLDGEKSDTNEFIEKIIMRIACPPYSER